jgi:hypothetical protein
VGQVGVMLRIETDVEVKVRTEADGHVPPFVTIEVVVAVVVIVLAAAVSVTVLSGGQLRSLVFEVGFVGKCPE